METNRNNSDSNLTEQNQKILNSSDSLLNRNKHNMLNKDLSTTDSLLQKRFDKLSTLTFYMTGIGFLLPYNALFAAMDYFKKNLYVDGYNPGFTFVVAVSGPMLFSQVISFLYLERIPIKVKMSFTFALNGLLTVMMVVLYNIFDYNDAA